MEAKGNSRSGSNARMLLASTPIEYPTLRYIRSTAQCCVSNQIIENHLILRFSSHAGKHHVATVNVHIWFSHPFCTVVRLGFPVAFCVSVWCRPIQKIVRCNMPLVNICSRTPWYRDVPSRSPPFCQTFSCLTKQTCLDFRPN